MWRRPLQTGPWGGRGGSCCCCRCCWRPRGGPGQGPASPRRPARRVCDRTRDAPGARTRSSRGGGRADAPRCAPREALERAGCPPGAVVQPRGSVRVLRDRAPGGGPGGPTQLSPQSVRVQLRPGEERSFPVRFRRAAAPPVDLYYLLDLSYSMRDDLGTLRRLARDILGTLRNATPAARIGFGSFVDKPVLPYVSTAPAKLRSPCPGRGEPCDPPRAFRHLLPLTGDPELFAQRVARQRVSGNLDAAEGGFDAIVQVAQCQERIGWRAAARLLLFASDDTFHAAGDGKLGGIVNPCDGRCHLDHSGVYASSHLYDYPSVGHVAQVLSAANIQPIFAVTGPNVPIYQELSRLIPRSVVRELRDDSSNVVQLIADAYSSLLSTVELQHSPLPPGISLSLEAHCGGNCPPNSTSAPCSGACERHQGCPAEARSAASACAGRAAAARVRRPRLRVSPGRGALPAGGARVQRPTELRVRDLPLPPRLRGTVLRALSLLPPALPAPAGLRRLRRLRAGAAAGELQPGLPPRHRAGGPRAPPGSRGWCRQETPDGRVLLFLIEGGPRGDEWDEEREVTLLVWAEQGAAVLPALVAALVAAPVALGMVALALARAALELRGRRETRREQNNLLFRSATSTTANPGYRPD
ncbi:integrin beta-7 isoform X2 [Columba livia]|uniref:integrin beta-7 isoform X2 n=1 Tax=Columba livia TaxID=8932 RepID=UPI0031BABA9E